MRVSILFKSRRIIRSLALRYLPEATSKAVGLQTSAHHEGSQPPAMGTLGGMMKSIRLGPVLLPQWLFDWQERQAIWMQLCKARCLNYCPLTERLAIPACLSTSAWCPSPDFSPPHTIPFSFTILHRSSWFLHQSHQPLISHTLWIYLPAKGRLPGDLSHQNQLPTKHALVWFLEDLQCGKVQAASLSTSLHTPFKLLLQKRGTWQFSNAGNLFFTANRLTFFLELRNSWNICPDFFSWKISSRRVFRKKNVCLQILVKAQC